jgi:hypothetical protein
MTWADVTREPKPRTVRQFGGLCLLILGGAGLYQALARSRPELGYTLLGIGIVCALAGLLAPGAFRWVFTGAMIVAFPIGFVVSQIFLSFLFFVVFLAVGLFLRARGWDAMLLKPKPSGASYWEAKTPPASADRYLRQY